MCISSYLVKTIVHDLSNALKVREIRERIGRGFFSLSAACADAQTVSGEHADAIKHAYIGP